MKKLLLVLLVFVLSGCSINANNDPIDISNEYIAPIKENAFYDFLNDEAKAIIDAANVDEGDIDNYLLEMWGKELIDFDIKDLNGDFFNLTEFKNSKVIIELAQYNCEHCKLQMKNVEELAKKHPEIVFIQYFVVGDEDEINDFYLLSGCDFVDEIRVVPENSKLREVVEETYAPLYTPTFMFFNNNVLTYSKIGEFSDRVFDAVYDIAFNNALPKEKLTTNDGISIFDTKREYDQVLADFSSDSLSKIHMLEKAEEITIRNVCKYVDYYDLYEADGEPLYSIDTFEKYINKELVVFYLANINNNLKNDLDLIEEFRQAHKNLNILVILIDNKDIDTSSAYKNLNIENNFDVISYKAIIPATLLEMDVHEYPACVYIDNNVVTGGFLNVNSLNDIEYGYSIFMGDTSVALIKNN